MLHTHVASTAIAATAMTFTIISSLILPLLLHLVICLAVR